MNISEISNTEYPLKSLVCIEMYNLSINLPKKNKWGSMLVQSKQTTVGDKKHVRKYYNIIENIIR